MRQEIAAREYLAGNALGRVAQKYAVSMEAVLEAAAKIPRQRVRAKMPRKGGCERDNADQYLHGGCQSLRRVQLDSGSRRWQNATVETSRRLDGNACQNQCESRRRQGAGN